MTLVHFDEAMIHLMQLSLVISRCIIAFSVFWLSQGSVGTLIRWGGWSSCGHICHSFLNLSLKTESVDIGQSYIQNNLAPFYGPRCNSTFYLLTYLLTYLLSSYTIVDMDSGVSLSISCTRPAVYIGWSDVTVICGLYVAGQHGVHTKLSGEYLPHYSNKIEW